MGFFVEACWELQDEIDKKDKKIKELTHHIEFLEEALFKIYTTSRDALKQEETSGQQMWDSEASRKQAFKETIACIYRYSEEVRQTSMEKRRA